MPKYTKQLTNFTFSFSSVSTFKTCPWSFKLGYIDKVERQQNFFSNFGSFCHLILEKYFSNKLDIWELLDYYEKHYYEEVKELPPSFLSQLAVSYYDAGRKFFEEFDKENPWSGVDYDDQISHYTGKNVFITDGNQYFNRPGPRIVDSLKILAEIFHPEVFNFNLQGKGWEKWDETS